jgi:TRAP-type C4-dicarboxylate transport system substrate-binding protein
MPLSSLSRPALGNGAHTIFAFKAVPISLPAGNVYIGMQRNTIQGADISAISIVDRRLYEVGKYYLNAAIHFTSDFCIANKYWFESLPKMVQQKLGKYVKEGNQLKRKVTSTREQKALSQLMPNNGVKIYTPTSEKIKIWKKASQPARELLIKRLPDTELVRKIELMQE